MNCIFGRIKTYAVKFFNYIRVDTQKKLVVFACILFAAALLGAAAAECAKLINPEPTNEGREVIADIDSVNDGTENGINVIKRLPKSQNAEKKRAENEKSEDLTEDYTRHESAEEYVKKTEENAVENALVQMTLEQKVYQMMFVAPEAFGGRGVKTADDLLCGSLSEKNIGGIILFSDNIESEEQVKALCAGVQNVCEIPLFIGVDEEGGSVSRVGSNGNFSMKSVPSAESLGMSGDAESVKLVYREMGAGVGALGFNLDFAPVADVSDTEGSQMKGRAFSSSFSESAEFAAAAVSGLHNGGVLAAAKHFPGIGSCTADTHNGSAEIEKSFEQLKAEEFEPFRKTIASGVDFVMVSHASCVGAGINVPSSLSGTVINGWLRGEMGFGGIVITDSLSMGAITDKYSAAEAAVSAVSAGADMLLMPSDLEQAHSAVVNAVVNGEISEERIDDSVRRILSLKFLMIK